MSTTSKKPKPCNHPRCATCGFRIRGKKHKEGTHHNRGRKTD